MANNAQGIVFTITADTAEAASKVQEFFSGMNESLKDLGGANELLDELGRKLATLFTVGAVVEFTKEAINNAEAMGKLAQQTGLALNTISALKDQAARLGTPFEALQVSLGMFSDKLFAAVRQGGPALQTFQDLGIKLVGTDGALRSVDKVLDEVADKFKGMADGPQKSAAAMDLFGRSGRELIPTLNQGAAEIERMREEGGPITPQMVADSTQFNMRLREIKETFELLFVALAERVLPTLKELSNWFKDITTSSGNIGANLKLFGATFAMEFTKALVDGIISASTFFGEAFIRAAGAVAKVFDSLLTDAVNSVILWLDKSPKLARLLGGSIQPVEISDVDNQVDTKLAQMKEGAEILRSGVNEFFDKGIAAARALMQTGPGAVSSIAGAAGAVGTGVSGTGNAPVSEAAKQLLETINRQWQEATQSKLRMLDAEEKQLKDKIDKEVLDVSAAEAAKTKVTELFAAKRKDLLQKEEDAKREIQLAAIQGRRTLLEQDPDQSRAEKAEKLLALLQEENRLLTENIEIKRKQVSDPAVSDESRLLAEKQLQDLQKRRAETEQGIKTTSSAGTFAGEFRLVLVDLKNTWDSWSHQVATGFKTVFESAISSVSSGITGLIMGTKTWGQALAQIGTTILTTVVQAIVEMGVRWVLTHVIMGQALTAFHALATALGWASAGQVIAQETAKAPILATNASTASVSSYGAASIVGIAALVAALGIGIAAALGAFEEGGFTGAGGASELAGVVHRGEFVFSAPAVQRIGVGTLAAMHSGSSAGISPSSSGKPGRVVIVSDERRLKDMENSTEFNNMIVRMNQRNRWKYRA